MRPTSTEAGGASSGSPEPLRQFGQCLCVVGDGAAEFLQWQIVGLTPEWVLDLHTGFLDADQPEGDARHCEHRHQPHLGHQHER